MISLTNRAKQLGPFLKLGICICVLPVLLISYPVIGIVGSIVGGAAYGYLSPIFATFDAVEEGKDDKLVHCFTVCFVFLLLLLLFLLSYCPSLQIFFTASSERYVEHHNEKLHGC